MAAESDGDRVIVPSPPSSAWGCRFCLPYPVPQPISPLGLGGLSSRKGGVGYQPRPGLSGNLRRRKRQRHPEAAGHPHPRSQAGRPVACRLPRAHAAARRYPRTAHATRAPRTPAAIRAAACAAEKKLGGVLCRCFILGAGSLDHAIRDKPCVDDRATRCRCLLRDRPLKKQYLQGKIFPSQSLQRLLTLLRYSGKNF